ncbi:MAG: hypothetical protein ACPIOQ_59885, partial [Promethearchaeia archaeon]
MAAEEDLFAPDEARSTLSGVTSGEGLRWAELWRPTGEGDTRTLNGELRSVNGELRSRRSRRAG